MPRQKRKKKFGDFTGKVEKFGVKDKKPTKEVVETKVFKKGELVAKKAGNIGIISGKQERKKRLGNLPGNLNEREVIEGRGKEVRRKKLETQQETTEEKKRGKLDIAKDILLGPKEITDPKTGEKTPLVTGVAPFTVAGGLPGGIATAQQAGVKVQGAIKKIPTIMEDIAGFGKKIPKTKSFFETSKFKLIAGATLTGIYGVNEFILSPNELAVWAAVDNIGSAIPFQMNDIAKGVKSGTIEEEKAFELIDQAEKHLENARGFIRKSTIANPKLWPAAKRLIEANTVATEAVELKKLEIEGLFEPEAITARENAKIAREREQEGLARRANIEEFVKEQRETAEQRRKGG